LTSFLASLLTSFLVSYFASFLGSDFDLWLFLVNIEYFSLFFFTATG